MGRYSFTPGDESVRYFTLAIAPRAAGGLVVGAASARQTGSGVAIAYTLSQPANVTVTITNMAGRPVWTQAVGAAAGGVSTVAWNLRGTNGTLVPAGRYPGEHSRRR
jgi:flagellar hook assembly protein FlgD